MPYITATRARSRRPSPSRSSPYRSGGSRSSASRPPRPDIYQTVTDRIIAELEAGTVPWVRPWDPSKGCAVAGSVDLPVNPTTGAAYSGVNILLLWLAAAENGWPTQRWMTYRQAQAIGAQVRRGEASTQIVKAGTFTPKGEREAARAEDRDPAAVPFLKSHRVFNVAQIDGLADDMGATLPPPGLSEVDARVRAILDGLGVRLVVGTARACYIPATDAIQLPSPDAFHDPIDWNRTALHEGGHATGAKHRLNRDLSGWFGGEDYAKEELVAELTAAFSCARLGIRPTVRHADYIGAWLAKLRDDKRCVVQAASAASKATDYLFSFLEADGDAGVETSEPGANDDVVVNVPSVTLDGVEPGRMIG